jgi:hypothetical protein
MLDPTEPEIDHSLFERRDWTTFEVGLGLTEILPSNMPEPMINSRGIWPNIADEQMRRSQDPPPC